MTPSIRTMLWRGCDAVVALVAITFIYRHFFRVNPTTVALTFLVLVLLISAYWGFRLAVAAAVVATALFNFYFLPPIGTFTISDPQNWVALLAFLISAVVASDLAERARREAESANRRRRELERLYAFSQSLLTNDNVLQLLNRIPTSLASTFGLRWAVLMVDVKDTIYRSDPSANPDVGTLRTTFARGEMTVDAHASYIPLRTGVRTTGTLAVSDPTLSRETLEAVGSLIGIAVERVRAVDEVTRTRAMQENERLRSALLDSVTHEFRTPLTSIKASVTTMLSALQLDHSQQTELLTVINEEADRLNRLVGEAAEMAQLDAGSVKLDKHPAMIRDVVDAAMNDKKSLLQDHPIEIRIPDDLPAVPLDFERIREVLMHLLENAAKYSDPGKPIVVTASVEKRGVAISVADQGPGIDTFEQALIFDKFYRGKNQRYSAAGTGMGLAICKVIVETHGGAIGVVSQLGHGSVFTFLLPLV